MSRRRRKARSAHLSLSATDAEWAVVGRNAARRRMSISRYVRELVLGDGFEASEGAAVALEEAEQRALCETVRTLPALMRGEGDGAALVEDLRARIAVLLDAWAAAMLREGRGAELRAVLDARVGADAAGRIMARLGERRAEAASGPPGHAGPDASS